MEKTQTAPPLLRTKLHAPILRPEVIERPRLQKRIIHGLSLPLTLVIAPAGFGKTTLIAGSLQRSQYPVSWLGLDRDDNQPGSFLRYIIAAFQCVDEKIGAEIARMLESVQPASHRSVLTVLVNDLEKAGTDIVLVLDDYQHITQKAVHEDLSFLLDHLPRNLHILIAARSDPPLPLARLRAGGQLLELRAADLRFSASETMQFLNDVMQLRLDERSLQLLEERTEGWIAGLQMAALSIREQKDVPAFIAQFSGSNRYIFDYLLEEVLTSQTPDVRRFLLYTSILERLTAPLCDVLLDHTEQHGPEGAGSPFTTDGEHRLSTPILDDLQRRNLFLVSLDESNTWFRYHHLFTDLLRARLEQTLPDAIPDLHVKAAGWLEANGFFTDAVHHYLSAAESDRAAALIEEYGPRSWLKDDLSVIRMANLLAPEVLYPRPKLSLYTIWLGIIQGDIPSALPRLRGLLSSLSATNSANDQDWMKTIVCLALTFLNPHGSEPGCYPLPDVESLENIPSDEIILLDAARILYVMTLGRRNENERAVELAGRWIAKEEITGHRLAIPSLVAFQARMLLVLGRLQETAALCHAYLHPLTKAGIRFVYSAAGLHIVLGEVLYERNNLTEAELQIREGISTNEPWEEIMTTGFGLRALARLLCARQDYTGALQVVDAFEEAMCGQSSPVEFREDFHTLRVHVLLAAGDTTTAGAWADQVQRSGEKRRHSEFDRFTLACVRSAQGRHAEVESLLAGFVPRSASGNLTTRHIETELLLAMALAGQEHSAEALLHIEASLILAEPEGYLRVFLDFGENAQNLLSAYLRSHAALKAEYARQILQAFASEQQSPLTASSAGILSIRERDVLELMALGLSNQEIAQRLFLASGTVKAHAASIYRKLDAANRTEAVNLARQQGLLS